MLARDPKRGDVDAGLDLDIAMTALVEEFADRRLAIGRTLRFDRIELMELCVRALHKARRRAAKSARE